MCLIVAEHGVHVTTNQHVKKLVLTARGPKVQKNNQRKWQLGNGNPQGRGIRSLVGQ